MAHFDCLCFRLTPVWPYGLFVVCFAWRQYGYTACWLFYFCLTPSRLYVMFCLLFVLAWCLCGYMACLVSFYLMPTWLNGMWCLFLPDVSVAILAFVLYVLPNASEAIWHMLFRLMPLWLYGMCCFHLKPVWLYDMYCFFSPDASVAIWLVLFRRLSRLTPPRP